MTVAPIDQQTVTVENTNSEILDLRERRKQRILSHANSRLAAIMEGRDLSRAPAIEDMDVLSVGVGNNIGLNKETSPAAESNEMDESANHESQISFSLSPMPGDVAITMPKASQLEPEIEKNGAIKPVESNGECDHAQINHTLGKSVVQNDVEENAFNTRIRTTPRTEAKLLNEAFETTKSFSNYGTPTMMSQFPTLKSPSSYKLQGFRPMYKSNYNRNAFRFRFLSLLMLGIIFRVLLEFQLFQTFITPFAVCFAFYELIVLTRKWITYPNGGYLENFLLLAGLNNRFVMVFSLISELVYDFITDFLVSSFSFLLTYITYKTRTLA